MKTIQEIANKLEVSRQYVYQRLKEDCIQLDTLKKEKRGKSMYFDDSAVEVIVNCVRKKQTTNTCHEDDTKRQETIIELLTKQLDDTRKERDEWRQSCKEAQEALREATKEIQRLADQSQQLHALTLKQAENEKNHRGLKGWLLKLKGKN